MARQFQIIHPKETILDKQRPVVSNTLNITKQNVGNVNRFLNYKKNKESLRVKILT